MYEVLVTDKMEEGVVMLLMSQTHSLLVLISLLYLHQANRRSPHTSHVRGDPGNLNDCLCQPNVTGTCQRTINFLMSFEYNEHRGTGRQDWFPWGFSLHPPARTNQTGKFCQLSVCSPLYNRYLFSLWILWFLLAHMPFPSSPFTKADTDDGFVIDFTYIH